MPCAKGTAQYEKGWMMSHLPDCHYIRQLPIASCQVASLYGDLFHPQWQTHPFLPFSLPPSTQHISCNKNIQENWVVWPSWNKFPHPGHCIHFQCWKVLEFLLWRLFIFLKFWEYLTHGTQYISQKQYPLWRRCIVRKFLGKLELVWKVSHLKSFTKFKLFGQLDIQFGQS